MSKQIIKQVVGIDVAQKELVVTLGRMYDDWTPELYSHQVFANNTKGFGTLVTWVKKQSVAEVPIQFVMEATGIYHEALAYYLDENSLPVSVVLPNKISNYFRSLTIKTVTDKTASQAIARFGLERKVDLWKRPLPIFKRLKQLTRERNQLVDTRTIMKNQLHAETSEAEPNPGTVSRIKKQIVFLNKQELEIKEDIKQVVSQEPKVQAAVDLISSIPGIGELTAITILAETNGFELIRNKRQLASYAGLDVKEKQSGTSIKGKPRISKQGNKFLRRAMHLPALSAIRHDERFKAVFARLVGRHGIKMKAAVAIQRKLLEMTYILFKTNTVYDKTYLQQLQTAETIKN
jgi:transposase